MDFDRIQDRIFWGQGAAARSLGATADAYRPRGPSDPISVTNRFLRLHAAFSTPHGNFLRANPYGSVLWYGHFDGKYTQPGDYLLQKDKIYFIAAQQNLLPILCVQTNRWLTIARSATAPLSDGYGGMTTATNVPLLTNWPASVIGAAGAGHPDAGLPTDGTVPYWTVLLPASDSIVLSPSDLVSDDLGRNAVISASELTSLGWRLTVKQATV
jgi:hypothetical protein